MINDILNYWYKIEYFTPCWPVDTKKDINLIKMELPWLKEQINENIRLSYDLYFGKIKSIDLIKWMLSEIKIPEEESIEQDNSFTCIFAFKVDKKGYYVPNSFSVLSLVWAVCKIVSAGFINVDLTTDDVKVFQNNINLLIVKMQEESKCSLDKLALVDIFEKISQHLNLSYKLANFSIWARQKTQHRKKDGSFTDVEPSTELFPSFYLNDIKRVIDNPNRRINMFLQKIKIKI